MQIKTNRLLLILIVALISSCSDNLEKNKIKTESSFFSLSDQHLPRFVDSNYVLIYRIGSIEWSPYTTVFAVNLNDGNVKNTKNISAFLWQYNFLSEGDKEIMFEENYLTSYKFKIQLNDLAYFNSLQGNKNDSILNSYKFNGEGRCDNIYVVRRIGQSNCYIINSESKKEDREFIKEIFAKISPQEHFQTFSLDQNCAEMDSLAFSLLKNGKIDDELQYCIDFESVKFQKKQ